MFTPIFILFMASETLGLLNYTIHSSTEAGFLAVHDCDVLIKTGYVTILTKTNLDLQRDISKLENQVNDYDLQCKEAIKVIPETIYESSVLAAKQQLKTALTELTEHKVNGRRVKRDSHGVILNLWHLFVGDRTESCPIEDLPDKYNFWWSTPQINAFAFVSNVKRDIVCGDTHTPIQETAGLLYLEGWCRILTDSRSIIPSLTHGIQTKKVYNLTISPIKTNYKTIYHSAITINDDELSKFYLDARDLNQDGDNSQIILITLIVSISISFILILALIIKCKDKKIQW